MAIAVVASPFIEIAPQTANILDGFEPEQTYGVWAPVRDNIIQLGVTGIHPHVQLDVAFGAVDLQITRHDGTKIQVNGSFDEGDTRKKVFVRPVPVLVVRHDMETGGWVVDRALNRVRSDESLDTFIGLVATHTQAKDPLPKLLNTAAS